MIFLALTPGPAPAQSIRANAVVPGGPIQISRERDLNFGDVLRGVPATVGLIGNASGRFRITGTPGAEVSLTFLLPLFLAVGANTMPISFGPNSAGYYQFQVPQFAVPFDPHVVTLARLRNQGPTGYLFVWLGGTVSPSAVQPPGLYTGNITLVVSYTGG